MLIRVLCALFLAAASVVEAGPVIHRRRNGQNRYLVYRSRSLQGDCLPLCANVAQPATAPSTVSSPTATAPVATSIYTTSPPVTAPVAILPPGPVSTSTGVVITPSGSGSGGGTCQTCYAKCGNAAVCFSEYGTPRWGWVNPIPTTTVTCEYWCGAAQCDTGKGTLMGTVTLDPVKGTATYSTSGGYIMTAIHLYTGKYPVPPNGLIANGQFPYIADYSAGVKYTNILVSGINATAGQYFIAHGVGC